jgi:hypothetical protein
MATLEQLITDRCAAIAEFKSDIYSHHEEDIIALNKAIERTPIASPEDLNAALNLIRLEATEPHSPLIIAMVEALESYLKVG